MYNTDNNKSDGGECGQYKVLERDDQEGHARQAAQIGAALW